MCLVNKEKLDGKHECGFISNYCTQYKDVKIIFRKYWPILSMDKVLRKSVLKDPVFFVFFYRKGPSFGDKVVKKIIDPPNRSLMFWDKAGFYSCRKCLACYQVSTHVRGLTEFQSTSNGKSF